MAERVNVDMEDRSINVVTVFLCDYVDRGFGSMQVERLSRIGVDTAAFATGRRPHSSNRQLRLQLALSGWFAMHIDLYIAGIDGVAKRIDGSIPRRQEHCHE